MSMSESGMFKNYQRGKRQSVSEVTFNYGMQYTNSLLDEGYLKTLVNYDLSEQRNSLKPRPGLRVSELVLPLIDRDSIFINEQFFNSEDVQLIAVKESGDKLQCIFSSYVHPDQVNPMEIWVATIHKDRASVTEQEKFSVNTYELHDGAPVLAQTSGVVPCTTIHNIPVINKVCFMSNTGAFAFGDNYYFFGNDGYLKHTEYSEADKKYIVKDVKPKEVDPSEAVNYGYNMLLGENAYSFKNKETIGILQLTGILPYSTKSTNELLMTPRANEDILFKCFFKAQVGKKYKFTWEWRHVGEDEWMPLQSLEQSPTYTVESLEGDNICLNDGETQIEALEMTFKSPSQNMLVRVQAYLVEEEKDPEGEANNSSSPPAEELPPTVEKAMTVGFDFTIENYGDAVNVNPEVYDLTNCKGMTNWNNRLVLYGANDPTILFISEPNDPSYFPYPNNISIYDEEIISVKAYLNSLLVFTTTKVHQVTLNEDGVSWSSTVVQSNLNIRQEDKHLIQVVRNMVYFKSGNYYFMVVPKAQSTTGELTLAPVTTGNNSFFDQFEKNVSDLIKDIYSYDGVLDLVDYYNYLNYDDIHNVYMFKVEQGNYVNVDVLYNVSSRIWRVYTYESISPLYPVRQDATQRSQLISSGHHSECTSNHVVVNEYAPIQELDGLDLDVTNKISIKNTKVDYFIIKSATLDTCRLRVTLISKNTDQAYKHIEFTYESNEGRTYYFTKDNYTLAIEYLDDNLVLCDINLSSGNVYDSDNSKGYLEIGTSMYITTVLINKTYDVVPLTECTPKNRVLYVYDTDVFNMDIYNAEYYLFNYRYSLASGLGVEAPYSYKYLVSKDGHPVNVKISSPAQFGYTSLTNKTMVLFDEPPKEEPIFKTLGFKDDQQVNYPVLGMQLFVFDADCISDVSFPLEANLRLENFVYDSSNLSEEYSKATNTYNNWQLLDTGFRRDNFSRNKRYREIQFQLNNIEGTNLDFGLEFQIDGQPRLSYYSYDIEHVVDYSDPNYGLIYVQQNVDMNLPITYIRTPGESVVGPSDNSWILNQSLFPDLTFWKVRAAVSGKGTAPRMRLISRNPRKFELLRLNWVYRVMNVR